ELLDYAREHFPHDTGVGFYDTPDSTTDLVARPREMSDGALPSGNALMAEVLLIYGTYGYDATLTDEGAAILRSMVRPIEDYPLFTGFLLAAAQRIIEPPKELVFAGDPGSDAVQELRKTALAIYDPTRVIGYSGTAGEHADRYPMLADRPLVGDAAASVCSEGTCRPAVTTADALAEMLKALFLSRSGGHGVRSYGMRIATSRVGDPRVIGRLALDVSLDETKEHRGLDVGEFGVMPAIPALVRVLVQVEELSVVTSAIDRDLVPVSDERPE